MISFVIPAYDEELLQSFDFRWKDHGPSFRKE